MSYTEDSEMNEPRPVFRNTSQDELHTDLLDDRPDVSRYSHDLDHALKKRLWFDLANAALRVRAVEITNTVGATSTKTRYEFD